MPSLLLDIVRLPILATHFLHHNQHEHTNFKHFIEDHYTDKHHEEDHKNHNNLPFHNHTDIAFSTLLAYIFEPHFYSFEKQKFVELTKNNYATSQPCFSSNVFLNIWKPPKLI